MQKASARGLFCDTRNYHRSKNDILRLVLYDAGDGIFLFTGFICGAFVEYCRGIPVYSFTRAVNTDTGIFVSHARSGARFGSGSSFYVRATDEYRRTTCLHRLVLNKYRLRCCRYRSRCIVSLAACAADHE